MADRVAQPTAALREMRCSGCPKLLARISLTAGSTIEILCHYCKTKNTVSR